MKTNFNNLIVRVLFIGIIIVLCQNCKKEDKPSPGSGNLQTNTVTDIDGNVYQTVTIAGKVWMKENLKTTHYRNGDPITFISSQNLWLANSEGAYCIYNNDTTYANTYGKLYNWIAVNDSRNIAPAGWHVATDAEWHSLALAFDSSSQLVNGSESVIAGSHLKEAGLTHWSSPNTGADNSSNFTGLGGGSRATSGIFEQMGVAGYWWAATEYDTNGAWYRGLYTVGTSIGRYPGHKRLLGLSVRCVKD